MLKKNNVMVQASKILSTIPTYEVNIFTILYYAVDILNKKEEIVEQNT
jgi:hypothetical protein